MDRPWRSESRRLLTEGYGVEDIALRLDVPEDDIRKLVTAMRESGLIEEMFGGQG